MSKFCFSRALRPQGRDSTKSKAHDTPRAFTRAQNQGLLKMQTVPNLFLILICLTYLPNYWLAKSGFSIFCKHFYSVLMVMVLLLVLLKSPEGSSLMSTGAYAAVGQSLLLRYIMASRGPGTRLFWPLQSHDLHLGCLAQGSTHEDPGDRAPLGAEGDKWTSTGVHLFSKEGLMGYSSCSPHPVSTYCLCSLCQPSNPLAAIS